MKNHYIEGFVKRASEYGFSSAETVELVKQADAGMFTGASGYGPGWITPTPQPIAPTPMPPAASSSLGINGSFTPTAEIADNGVLGKAKDYLVNKFRGVPQAGILGSDKGTAPGAAIGGALGALGGPLAPLTIPAGAALGGWLGKGVHNSLNTWANNNFAPDTRTPSGRMQAIQELAPVADKLSPQLPPAYAQGGKPVDMQLAGTTGDEANKLSMPQPLTLNPTANDGPNKTQLNVPKLNVQQSGQPVGDIARAGMPPTPTPPSRPPATEPAAPTPPSRPPATEPAAPQGAGPTDKWLAKTMGSYDKNSRLDRAKADRIRAIYHPGMSHNDVYADKQYAAIRPGRIPADGGTQVARVPAAPQPYRPSPAAAAGPQLDPVLARLMGRA